MEMKKTEKQKGKKTVYASNDEVRKIIDKNVEKDKELLSKLAHL